jgi:monofunctional biosynthetic peptidoglycan transglycosylase
MVYGVGHASRYYFGKPPSGLTVRESAFLASMLPGPKVYDPYRNLGRVVRRSDRILRRMAAAHMITEEEYKAALAEEPNIEGLSRKVESTIASPPPEEMGELPVPGNGPGPEPPSPGTSSPRNGNVAGSEPSPVGPASPAPPTSPAGAHAPGSRDRD